MRVGRQRGGKGVSLAEAIVACFILTTAMAVSAALYHSALKHSARIDKMHRATRAIDRRIEKIRAWSRDVHGTNGLLAFDEGWSGDIIAPGVDSEYPEVEVSVSLAEDLPPTERSKHYYQLLSPSSAFEEVHFAAQADQTVADEDKEKKRVLNDSAQLLVVTGKWGEGPKEKLVARFLLTDPVKDYGWSPDEAFRAIKFEGVTSSLGKNSSITITARVEDRKGKAVKNAVVSWYIDPASKGKAQLETHPSLSDRVTLTNKVRVKRPSKTDMVAYTGGWVQVVARVRLGGIEAVNKTTRIELSQ